MTVTESSDWGVRRTLPFRVVGAAMNWAIQKFGSGAWVILGLVVAGGTPAGAQRRG
jgi:hypothetical protein